MINFKAIGHNPNSFPSKIVHIRYHDDLMTSFYKALGQLIAMGLDTPELWCHEIRGQ